MDDVTRTLDTYESDPERYVERYLDSSVAERYGDDFRDALPGDRVLDAGCGPGADAATFTTEGYDVVGVDLTPAFLRTATARAPGAAFVRGDMRQLPLADASVDGVWASASVLHVPRDDAPATLREFARVLRADGALYISVKSSQRDYATDGRHFEYYTPDDLRALLEDSPFAVETVRGEKNWVWALARLDE